MLSLISLYDLKLLKNNIVRKMGNDQDRVKILHSILWGHGGPFRHRKERGETGRRRVAEPSEVEIATSSVMDYCC